MGKEAQMSSGNEPGANTTGWPFSRPAHALSHEEVVRELTCDGKNGLSKTEAPSRLQRCGRNELGQAPGVQPVKIFIRQIANAMTMVLILAMAVSFGIQSWIEGGVISAVVMLNIVVGFIQEYSAEKTMDSLRSLSSPTAHAIRDGEPVVIPTAEVVPGDLMELKAGDTIPADIRLIEAVNFETDEALLTGESLPVRKDADVVFGDDTGPGDRLNVAYSSSTVTKGRGKGVVYATGMNTEIGTIAAALQAKDSRVRQVKRKEDGSAGPHRYLEAWTLTGTAAVGRFLGVNIGTPLQQKLSRLAILLFIIALVCALLVFAANKFRVSKDIIIYAVATGLSMIPSSLVVILTITMAYGTKTMVERHVIVRNLRSLEALGAVTDICSDKTGTLTQGRMVTKKVWVPGRGTYSIGISKNPFDPTVGDLEFNSLPPSMINSSEKPSSSVGYVDQVQHDSVLQFLKVASLANLAIVHQADDGQWRARGDPTEIALQVFSCRFGWSRAELTTAANGSSSPAWKEIAEFPFDSDVKKMSVIFKDVNNNTVKVFTKGAVERVITSCVSIFKSSGLVPMTEEIRGEIIENMEALASQGLRVLALASRTYTDPIVEGEEINRATVENNLNFCGLVGIYDPPRGESMGSVRECHDAGISVHMLTGDHPGTARAIAVEVGILPSQTNNLSKQSIDSMVMTATEFDNLSDAQVDKLPILPLVIARCAPNTKVRMIEALHRRKRFCAMTGDGVNDSPSLKRADVGIAMGQAGSDVAKEASDIILTDDNFASITNAIKEGRRMFDNIQKYVLHVLAENIAQAGTLLIGLVFKDQTGTSVFALSPVQILWVIVATSGMPDMGLGFEKAQPNIMVRPPQSLKTGIFTREVLLDMVVYGIWVTALCLSSFSLVAYGFGDGDLGEDCNNNYSNAAGEPVCDLVFRARATTFACLTWFALFLAWEMVDLRRSFFRLKPGTKQSILTGWMHDVWQNQFLFWAIIAGFATIFPTMYIPVINHSVFKHTGITWEWGIVAVETVLFFAGVETWKFGKRVYFRRQERNGSVLVGVGGSGKDLEARGSEPLMIGSERGETRSSGSGSSERTTEVREQFVEK